MALYHQLTKYYYYYERFINTFGDGNQSYKYLHKLKNSGDRIIKTINTLSGKYRNDKYILRTLDDRYYDVVKIYRQALLLYDRIN